MSYDQNCQDLAEHFMQDVGDVLPGEVQDLAQHIQNSIEDWLAETDFRRKVRPTCLHAKVGVCLDCWREIEEDPTAWDEFGNHEQGKANAAALMEEIAADAARSESYEPDPNLPF